MTAASKKWGQESAATSVRRPDWISAPAELNRRTQWGNGGETWLLKSGAPSLFFPKGRIRSDRIGPGGGDLGLERIKT